MDGTGHISCCVRSILTNGGVLSSDGPMLIGIDEGTAQIGRMLVEMPQFLFLKMLIGIGEGTAQIGRILVEIPRFLFLKIFIFISEWIHVPVEPIGHFHETGASLPVNT